MNRPLLRLVSHVTCCGSTTQGWQALYYCQAAAVIIIEGSSLTLKLPAFMLKLRPVDHLSCVLHRSPRAA